MITRVATMTVIRGNGECQAIVNGVVQREIQRLQAEQHRELDALHRQNDILARNRSDLRRAELDRLRRRPRLSSRISSAFSDFLSVLITDFFVFCELTGLHDFHILDAPHPRLAKKRRAQRRH